MIATIECRMPININNLGVGATSYKLSKQVDRPHGARVMQRRLALEIK